MNSSKKDICIRISKPLWIYKEFETVLVWNKLFTSYASWRERERERERESTKCTYNKTCIRLFSPCSKMLSLSFIQWKQIVPKNVMISNDLNLLKK